MSTVMFVDPNSESPCEHQFEGKYATVQRGRLPDNYAWFPSKKPRAGGICEVPQLSDIGLWETASDQASARSLVLW